MILLIISKLKKIFIPWLDAEDNNITDAEDNNITFRDKE